MCGADEHSEVRTGVGEFLICYLACSLHFVFSQQNVFHYFQMKKLLLVGIVYAADSLIIGVKLHVSLWNGYGYNFPSTYCTPYSFFIDFLEKNCEYWAALPGIHCK